MFHLQIKEYLNEICEQIKYKPVRKEIAKEIEDHINDIKEDITKNILFSKLSSIIFISL